MTNKKLIIFAFLMALLTTGFAAIYLNQLEKEANKPAPQVRIVVPKDTIKPFTQITAEMVEVIKMDEKSKHPDAAMTLEEVVGAVAEIQLFKGEPILKSKIVKSDQAGAALSYKIPEGMRAMNITYESGVGKFLRAGDRIDIVGVIETPVKELKGYDENGMAIYEQLEAKRTSQLFLQDILVLAVGNTDIRPTSSEEGAKEANKDEQKQNDEKPVAMITLMVTPHQAEHVALLERMGQMELILRPAGKDERVNPQGVTVEDVLSTEESGGSQ